MIGENAELAARCCALQGLAALKAAQLELGRQVRARMAELAAPLNAIDRVEPAAWSEPGAAGALERQAFASPVADFYLTDPIGRASAVMAECSRLFVHGAEQEATGTHG